MHSGCRNSRHKPRKSKSRTNGAILSILLALSSLGAIAADFKTIGSSGTILYDGPSTRANKLFVTTANYPVEIISADGAWVRVRDFAGDLAWVERKALSDRQVVVVTVPTVEARLQPDDRAASAFQVAQGVVLEVVDTNAPGWLRVRHRDGASGYVRLREVWGY
ncbi:MAG: SH3 domain-containing protein [Burkholderiales bacterium]